ncbi:hypothetical protein TL16_g11554 [Triparma laevis f. inornata]|uniref:Uncharacterized protein n=1 Tax=Triparma laevis f. inornata TaxID=1714386 RepID=A0A9W7BFE0_9STRA|nr:hypothetical protein TL16_g11554 [Triparma laevis f. inornata]
MGGFLVFGIVSEDILSDAEEEREEGEEERTEEHLKRRRQAVDVFRGRRDVGGGFRGGEGRVGSRFVSWTGID